MKRFKFASVVAAVVIALGIAGCACSSEQPAPSDQDDSRYADRGLEAPATTEATDGTDTEIPEDYVPAYDSEAEDNEVTECSLDEEFEVNGVKYTVHAPSKVHASQTREGEDSFLVDIDIDRTGAIADAATDKLFFFTPDGLYATDLVEMVAREEYQVKIAEAEAAGATDEEIDALYEEMSSLSDQQSDEKAYTRTVEIAYDGDGSYSVEVRDFTNSRVYRVAMNIAL